MVKISKNHNYKTFFFLRNVLLLIILGLLFLIAGNSMEGADRIPPSSVTAISNTAISNTAISNGTVLPRGSLLPNESIGNVAVVCPLEFQEALSPWLVWREKQGYQVHIITTDTPTVTEEADPNSRILQIRQTLLNLQQTFPLTAILLVGDASPVDENASWHNIIPTPRIPAQVISRFSTENHIGSDSWYADMNNDGFPDIAIGRFPVRTKEELAILVNKIISYETLVPPGAWQRRINFIAGIGGFGMLDPIIETVVRKLISSLLPCEYESTFTQANWKSAFCPYPPMIGDITLSRLNEGALLWVYMGHGFHQGLDKIHTPSGDFPILDMKDIALLNCVQGYPIAFFFACYTGALDVYDDSLAEQFILAPKGPVAALAASRLSMPYGLAVFGQELLDVAFTDENRTLGEIVLRAKKQMFIKNTVIQKTSTNSPSEELPSDNTTKINDSSETQKKIKNEIRELLDQTARTFDPSGKELDGQLFDHVHSINLLGDPLLHIRFPEKIKLEMPTIALSAHSIEITGILPNNVKNEVMEGVLELSLPRQRSGIHKPSRKKFELSDTSAASYQNTYDKANHLVLTKIHLKTDQGRFKTNLTLPDDISGTHIIRVLLQNERHVVIGGQYITIRPFDTTVPRPSGYYLEEEKNGSKR